jgi:hypothetical protein
MVTLGPHQRVPVHVQRGGRIEADEALGFDRMPALLATSVRDRLALPELDGRAEGQGSDLATVRVGLRVHVHPVHQRADARWRRRPFVQGRNG